MKDTHNLDKFMESSLSVRRFLPLTRKNATLLNLLALILQGRSEHLNTREAWARAASHAYGFQSGWGIFGFGSNIMVEFRARWLRSCYIPEPGYPGEIAGLMEEALFHPYFSQESLDEAKYLLKNRILMQRQDPDARALLEAMDIAQENHTISIPLYGDEALIDAVSLQEIEETWNLLNAQNTALLTSGPVEAPIRKVVEDRICDQEVSSPYVLLQPQPFRQTILEKDISQSSLVQIYATGIAWDELQSLRLQLFNMLLGASSTSLLFEQIREQHSYCYSISSMVVRLDGGLVITTAAHRDHMEDVIRLIAQIIEEIRTKDYDRHVLRLAKNELLDLLSGQQDSLQTLMEQAFMDRLRGWNYSMEECMEIIEETTPDDLAEIAKGLHLLCQAQVLQKETSLSEDEVLSENGEGDAE